MTDSSIFAPRIPEVDIRPEIDAVFARARAVASQPKPDAEGVFRRQVIIITPGRLLIAKDCPLMGDIPVEQLALLGELVPPEPKVNIAVIAFTHIEALKADIRRAIPFFDFLLGFAALGHTVWVFEGHASALNAGCLNADLILVDNAMAIALDTHNPDWQDQARSAMRGETIRLISRPNVD